MLLIAGWLGFSLNPLRAFRWTLVLSGIQNLYLVLVAIMMIGSLEEAGQGSSVVAGLALAVGCVCSLLALAETVVAWVRSRAVSEAVLRWCLTLCAGCFAFGLIVASGPLVIDVLFVAPPALLAASLWLPRKSASVAVRVATGAGT